MGEAPGGERPTGVSPLRAWHIASCERLADIAGPRTSKGRRRMLSFRSATVTAGIIGVAAAAGTGFMAGRIASGGAVAVVQAEHCTGGRRGLRGAARRPAMGRGAARLAPKALERAPTLPMHRLHHRHRHDVVQGAGGRGDGGMPELLSSVLPAFLVSAAEGSRVAARTPAGRQQSGDCGS